MQSHDPLGEHTFIVIYALHTLQESLVAPILPCVELKLKSSIPRERKRAFRLLTRIFSEPVGYSYTEVIISLLHLELYGSSQKSGTLEYFPLSIS